jgi:hypothetical protein
MTMITRELEWWPTGATEPRTIRVNVSLPEPHPTLGGYQCTLTIEGFSELEGFGERRSGTFHDTEGMLALTHALNNVPQVIEYLVRKAGGGRVTSRLRSLDDIDFLLEAERELEYLAPGGSAPVPIKVAISPPVEEDDKMWTCTLTITGFGAETVQHADTIGAITEALYLASIALRRLVEPGGRLTYHGSEELGFPPGPAARMSPRYTIGDGPDPSIRPGSYSRYSMSRGRRADQCAAARLECEGFESNR